jgi:hypothetical protein
MRSVATRLAAVAVALSTVACATGGPGRAGGGLRGEESAQVEVKNNNWANIAVYLVRSGMRTRLGMVTSMKTEIFRIPRALLGGTEDVRLVADPIGSSEVYTTPAVQVWPGQTVALTLENHLAISSVAVWNTR